MGAAAAGTGLAWTSPVLDQLKSVDSTIPITKEQGTWIASMLAIGAILGAVPSGILADKLGRKKAAIVIAVPYIISYLLTVFAQNVWWLYGARLLIGTFTFAVLLQMALNRVCLFVCSHSCCLRYHENEQQTSVLLIWIHNN